MPFCISAHLGVSGDGHRSERQDSKREDDVFHVNPPEITSEELLLILPTAQELITRWELEGCSAALKITPKLFRSGWSLNRMRLARL